MKNNFPNIKQRSIIYLEVKLHDLKTTILTVKIIYKIYGQF